MYQLNIPFKKALFIYGSIGFLQFIYIFILTELNFGHVLSFLTLFFLGWLLLFVISRRMSEVAFNYFESKLYKVIFIIAFISIVMTSRYEYIFNTLSHGLADTRLSEDVGHGGFYSVINAMFYPLGMLAVYHVKSKFRTLAIMLTLMVAIVDIVSIGTRNAPFFIFVYFFIFNSELKINIKYFLNLIIVMFLLIFAFEATTRERSGFVGFANEYWYFKAIESEVMSGSILNISIFDWAYQNFWVLLPFYYLIAYISHSIVDFFTFITNYTSWFDPTFAHLLDQLSMYTFSDRSTYQDIIGTIRVRSGYYQTLYASIIIDTPFTFPFIGGLSLVIVIVTLYKSFNSFLSLFTIRAATFSRRFALIAISSFTMLNTSQ